MRNKYSSKRGYRWYLTIRKPDNTPERYIYYDNTTMLALRLEESLAKDHIIILKDRQTGKEYRNDDIRRLFLYPSSHELGHLI